MKYYIGDDAHKKYSVFVTVNENGKAGSPERVPHDKDLYRKYLATLPPGFTDCDRECGQLVLDDRSHGTSRPSTGSGPSQESQALNGTINKTDKLDARGLAMLNLNGSLPAVWIPPARTKRSAGVIPDADVYGRGEDPIQKSNPGHLGQVCH